MKMKKVRTYEKLKKEIERGANIGYEKIEDFFGWDEEEEIEEKKADLKEWFSWSANYAEIPLEGPFFVIFIEGNTELSGCPV